CVLIAGIGAIGRVESGPGSGAAATRRPFPSATPLRATGGSGPSGARTGPAAPCARALTRSVAAMLPQEFEEGMTRPRDVRREERARTIGFARPGRFQDRAMLVARPRMTLRQRELQTNVPVALVLQTLEDAHRQRPAGRGEEDLVELPVQRAPRTHVARVERILVPIQDLIGAVQIGRVEVRQRAPEEVGLEQRTKLEELSH